MPNIRTFKDLHQQAVSRQNRYSAGPEHPNTYNNLSAEPKEQPRKVTGGQNIIKGNYLRLITSIAI